MKPITVKKDELLATLKANRDAHRKIFEEALEGYRTEAIRLLEEHIDRIKSGKPKRVYVTIPYPEDHTEDYDNAIAMLEMDIGDTIQLDEESFLHYVRDQWQWKRQFLTSNAFYSATAASLTEEDDD